jgi:hypothetical protein
LFPFYRGILSLQNVIPVFSAVCFLCCYVVNSVLTFCLSSRCVCYVVLDRIACSVVVDYYVLSLPVLWDVCVANWAFGDGWLSLLKL